jgi:hypothetical protein
MSGGHFCDNSYPYYKVSQFADELEEEIQDKKDEYGHSYNFSPEVIEYVKEQLPKMRKMAEIMRAVDYLYSGDHGDDSFLLLVKEIEQKYAD